MRDFRDAKAMAQSLRRALTAKTVSITHSESLELVAKAFSFDNWNILAARIEAERPAPDLAPADGPVTLYCSFCGKSQHQVAALIAGPTVFICDECVGLCDNIIEDQAIDRTLREAPERDAFAATAEIMRRRSDDELEAYKGKAERWRDHLVWCLQKSADALTRLDTRAPGSPDALAETRGPARDPTRGKSRDEIVAQRASLQAIIDRLVERLRVAETVVRERAGGGAP